jgi:alcohol dehydrogenase (NADP+)
MIPAHGYAAQRVKGPLTLYSFERRDPRDYDVVIDIQYCGICHTDIHQVRNEWGGSPFPMLPGHVTSSKIYQSITSTATSNFV